MGVRVELPVQGNPPAERELPDPLELNRTVDVVADEEFHSLQAERFGRPVRKKSAA